MSAVTCPGCNTVGIYVPAGESCKCRYCGLEQMQKAAEFQQGKVTQ